MKINTVLGTMDTKDMGVTLMHEHIATIDWNFARAFPGFYDRERTVKMFCEDMEQLKEYGVKTFVDATPIDLGRDVQLLRECAERSGINVLAATGLYWAEEPNYTYGADPEYLADLLVGEIENGMEGTDIKPAFLKCATQYETATNESMIRGFAIAGKATGLPIMAHTNSHAPSGLFQKRIFEEMGVAPEKVYYCHVFNQGNIDYIRKLAEGGSFLGCDQIMYLEQSKMERIADMTAELIREGLGKQICFSCDGAIHSDFGMVIKPGIRDRLTNTTALKDGIKKNVFEKFIPMLHARGITEEQTREIMELNPRRYFGEKI